MAVYFEVKPETQGNGYTHTEIWIWVDRQKPKENGELPYLPTADIELEYQRGAGDYPSAYEKDKATVERQMKYYYAESVERIYTWGWLQSETLTKLASLFRKMEKKRTQLHEQGLTIDSNGDIFKERKTLLQLIGAVEIQWNSNDHKHHLVDTPKIF